MSRPKIPRAGSAKPGGELREYERKRDFARTSEPRAARSKRRGAHAPLQFVVQKHAARGLHYDFRLELDGVLKSWAVPKGPSLEPTAKRMAVETEDHPLAYADFEGTIPKGEYGGGTVVAWDRGTWAAIGDPHVGLEKGHLEFDLRGNRLGGRWHLVRMRARPRDRGKKKLAVDQGEGHGANARNGPAGADLDRAAARHAGRCTARRGGMVA